jgi:hypothetical protein
VNVITELVAFWICLNMPEYVKNFIIFARVIPDHTEGSQATNKHSTSIILIFHPPGPYIAIAGILSLAVCPMVT